MLQDTRHLIEPEAAVSGTVTAGMKFYQGVDEAVSRSLRQGKSHGDVGVFHFFGQGVEDRLQQGLVTEYNGCLLFVGSQVLPNPLGQVTGLSVLCRRFDVGNLFRPTQVVETGSREFRRMNSPAS